MLGTRLLVLWLSFHPGKTVENVLKLKITDFFSNQSVNRERT